MSSGSDEEAHVAELTAASEARLGRTLADKWTLEELLGVGGMGAVYGARHRNGKTVAIKVLHSRFALSPSIRRRFLREGHVANRVAHPDAVSILDDGETKDGEAFLVMDRLEGGTLHAKLEREGKLAPRDAAHVCAQVLDVLHTAHASGVIHRDIKPENVFLPVGGGVKVLDFGIASVRDASFGDSLATRPGTTRGTPAYMAPEQARGATGAEIDARTDLWAVGAMLFTLLTGRTVHDGDAPMQVLFLAGTQPARPVRTVAPAVPQALAEVVDRALAFDAADRWPDALSMRNALDAAMRLPGTSPTEPERAAAALGTEPEVELPSQPQTRARSPRIAAMALVLGALVTALLVGTRGARSNPGQGATPAAASSAIIDPPAVAASGVGIEAVAPARSAPADAQSADAKPSPRRASERRAIEPPAGPPAPSAPTRDIFERRR